MKRIIAVFVIVLFVVFSFAGCKKAESSANGNTPVPGDVYFADIQKS